MALTLLLGGLSLLATAWENEELLQARAGAAVAGRGVAGSRGRRCKLCLAKIGSRARGQWLPWLPTAKPQDMLQPPARHLALLGPFMGTGTLTAASPLLC